MMSGLSKLVSKKAKVEVDGKEYTLSSLNLSDWAELHEFAENEFFSDMKRRLAALPPESSQYKQLADKVATTKKNDLISELMEYTTGTKASLFQLWLMLKHEHPEISQDEVSKMAISYSEFLDIAEELSGVKDSDSANPQEAASS